jgi:transposase
VAAQVNDASTLTAVVLPPRTPGWPQRLVPLGVVAARAEASPRLRSTAQRRLADEAQLDILHHRVDQLDLRLAALERRQPSDPPT